MDPKVIFELIKLRVFRNDLTLQINGTNEFRKIGGDGAFKEENVSLVGWTDHEIFSQRIRNYTSQDIHIEVRHTFPGHIVFKSQLKPKLHDYQTVEFKSTVAAGKKMDLLFEVVRLQGNSVKQNNVTLQDGKVTP